MKKAKKNTAQKTSKAMPAPIIIDKRLDALSNTILFKKKLEKANRVLARVGVPA